MKALKISALILMILVLFWGCGFGWFALRCQFSEPYNLNQPASAIVVLSGGRERFERALDLFAARRGLYLFMTSVHPSNSQAQITNRWRAWVAAQGRPPMELPLCCIVLDQDATTTAQNALMTKRWIENLKATDGQDIESIRLVTSNYHMPRALVDFKRILPELTIYPHPIVSPAVNGADDEYWMLLFQEYNKYLLRIAQSWLPSSLQAFGA